MFLLMQKCTDKWEVDRFMLLFPYKILNMKDNYEYVNTTYSDHHLIQKFSFHEILKESYAA
jgi:hypothetical protein